MISPANNNREGERGIHAKLNTQDIPPEEEIYEEGGEMRATQDSPSSSDMHEEGDEMRAHGTTPRKTYTKKSRVGRYGGFPTVITTITRPCCICGNYDTMVHCCFCMLGR